MTQAKHPQKPADTLSSIYPSQEMMDFVMAIIKGEQQNPSREQTAEHPTSGEKNYLSSMYSSRKMAEYVMKITRELE